MSHETQTKSAPKGLLLVSGVVLMVAGMAVHRYFPIPFLEDLGKKGLPIDPGETIATIGVLLILFPIVNLFYIVPLVQAIKERNSNLEKTFAEVEQLRDEMSKMKTDYEARLVSTESNAREQIQNQIKEAQALRQTLTSEATQRADQLLKQAKEQIEQEKGRAISELRASVIDLTMAATEKLIGENLDDARNRKLVDDFITSVEVSR